MGKKKPRIPNPKSAVGGRIPTVNSEPAHSGSTNHLPPAFSFYHFDNSAECISDWSQDETRALFAAMKQASSMCWQRISSTGGQGRAAQGLAYKQIPLHRCKRPLPASLGEDIDEIAEMRVSKAARFFGIRHEATFYVVWLDRSHTVVP